MHRSVDAHSNVLHTLSKTEKSQIKALDIVGDILDDLKQQN